LTHVSVAEVFNNTVLMFAMPRGASDDEWMTVSRTRRAALQALKSLANSDPEINNSYYSQEFLVSNMRIQCDYALGTKVSNYLATFKTQIEATEGMAFIPRITALTSRGLGSELIEYDSVINQMLMWCWMLHVSEDNPVYVMLEALAAAEMVRRARQTPKPVRPAAVVRPVVATGRPLPAIPPARVH
jgi:hypothetical protein